MTPDERCEAFKYVLNWAKNSKTVDDVIYLEERIYAARVASDEVVILKASSWKEAYDRIWNQ